MSVIARPSKDLEKLLDSMFPKEQKEKDGNKGASEEKSKKEGERTFIGIEDMDTD